MEVIAILTKGDLKFNFDTHLFAIVPKSNDYIVHQLQAIETSTREFAPAYHNHKVVRPRAIIPEFLFARVARAILMLIKGSRLRALNNDDGRSSDYNIKSE